MLLMCTRKEQVLMHLARINGGVYREIMPFGTTQDGIADGIGISRGHASIVLKQLETDGMVYHERRIADGGKIHRNCYRLMPYGWMAVREIIADQEAM